MLKFIIRRHANIPNNILCSPEDTAVSYLAFKQTLSNTIMLLLTNCEVHTGNIRTEVLKYGPNELRSVGKAEVRIPSRMDRTNWSIRASLYSP